ncbi:hypothetical protein [Microbacterium deminutum]|uniref:DNA-binding protein n=1 Tax=Microbacterium deminutum TaxID=344164 RepID=A0ABN2R155_9MICO
MTIEQLTAELVYGEPHESYLTRREAATRCKVPLSTFDSLRRQNRVPFPDAEMGKHMLWRESTIDAFLDAGGTRAS